MELSLRLANVVGQITGRSLAPTGLSSTPLPPPRPPDWLSVPAPLGKGAESPWPAGSLPGPIRGGGGGVLKRQGNDTHDRSQTL